MSRPRVAPSARYDRVIDKRSGIAVRWFRWELAVTNDVDRHVGRFRRKIFRSGGIAAAAVLLVIAGIWIGFAGGRSAPTAGVRSHRK